MSVVQSYKAQIYVHGAVIPCKLGGASLQWRENYIRPGVTGNYWQQNKTPGFQLPMIDADFALLDADPTLCPLHWTLLQTFLNRSNDNQHDVSPIANPKFFDGSSGWDLPFCKPATFTLSGGKNQEVQMSATYACYVPEGASNPAKRLTPVAAYNAFQGAPVSFTAQSYTTGPAYDVPLDGVVSWQVTFSNNITPDMSMVSGTGQQLYPVDVNASMMSAAFNITANARPDGGDLLATGDSFKVSIVQGNISVGIILPSLVIETDLERAVAQARQMRPYSGNCDGINNNQNGAVVVITQN